MRSARLAVLMTLALLGAGCEKKAPVAETILIGHVGSLAPLIDMGVLRAPLHVDCVLGVIASSTFLPITPPAAPPMAAPATALLPLFCATAAPPAQGAVP